MKNVKNNVIAKSHFIEKLTYKTGVQPSVAKLIFEEILDLIVDELKNSNRIEFRNYFVLGSKIQNERIARNVTTGEEITIPERRTVYFKKGNKLENLPLESLDWLNR